MKVYTLDLNFQNTSKTIAAYLVVGPKGPVLVETGPGSTLEVLKVRLAEHGYSPTDIRHVLVTHIHLDHAGAAGWWAQQNAQVYVHHVGAPHLVDPSKLFNSAKRIYGETMDALWGTILPAPAERVRALYDGDHFQAGGLTFTALDTPGHARHHIVYRLRDGAFTGDAAGIRPPNSTFISLPAAPPEFDLEAWQNTLTRLQSQDLTTLYPTHFGPITNVHEHLEALVELIEQSAEFVRARMQAGIGRETLAGQYQAWNGKRARSQGLTESDLYKHELVNPSLMSVDGLMRYWRKRGV